MDYTSLLKEVLANRFVHSTLILVLFLFLSKFFLYLSKRHFSKMAAATPTPVDDFLIQKLENPASYVLSFIGLKFALIPLEVSGTFGTIVTKLTTMCIVIIFTYIIVVGIDTLIEAWGIAWSQRTKSSIDDDVLPLIRKFSKVLLIMIGMLVVLSDWGVSIGPFLASLGIAGIAIGFAVKDSLANIFGGISLILDKNFKVGDTVKLDDATIGKIMDIGLRSTRIRTFDNELIIMPNGMLSNMKIINFAKPEVKARLQIKFGVVYGTDPDKVKKVILAILKKNKQVLKDPEPFLRFKKMSDFSLDFVAYAWSHTYKDRFMLKDQLTTQIYKELQKRKIGIPFPTRTVYIKK